MKFTFTAILALGAATPATSFSYLESLSTGASTSLAPPKLAPPAPPAPPAEANTEAPFFFTNGAKDEPADSPAFFFTNGSTDVPAPAGSYLDNIGSGTTSVSGPGMTSYLDALPKNSVAGGGGGVGGMSSYASSLNNAAVVQAAAVPSDSLAPPAPAAPSDFSSAPAPVAVAAGNYLEALGGGGSASTSGPGITSYLDALPRPATLSGGAGISTYISAMTSTNVVSGPGMQTYTDALSPTVSGSKSYSPFGASSSRAASTSAGTPAFAIGSVTGRFDFSLEADAELIEQLKAAGNRRVRLSGRVTSISR